LSNNGEVKKIGISLSLEGNIQVLMLVSEYMPKWHMIGIV